MAPQQQFDDMYNELGCFEYSQDGFSISCDNSTKSVKWNDITELVAFKSDLITTDRIDMHIVYGDYFFTISEELPGWYRFIRKLKEIFPIIHDGWDVDIMFPPFAENRTVLFQKTISSQ